MKEERMATNQRPINAYDVLQNWLDKWKPDCSFNGSTKEDFLKWKRKFRQHYRQCLGTLPQPVPLKLKTSDKWDKGDHIRERVIFDSCFGVTVPAFLLTPKGIPKGEKRPGIIAAHGHGGGKDDITGVSREKADPAQISLVDGVNYEYALEAVRKGYVVIAPDWCPFGERKPGAWWSREPSRDPCNIVDLAWRYFGRPLITQNIWDGMRAVDVLQKHPSVDPKKIAVIGLSYGGTMSTHLLINDPRIRAGVVSGYISTVREDALRQRGTGNTCGAQQVPNLLLHGDIPDMLGLAVPKAIMFEMGEQELCFHFPDMQKAYKHLEKIYRAAGCPERLARDVHPQGHRWSGRLAWDWLAEWL